MSDKHLTKRCAFHRLKNINTKKKKVCLKQSQIFYDNYTFFKSLLCKTFIHFSFIKIISSGISKNKWFPLPTNIRLCQWCSNTKFPTVQNYLLHCYFSRYYAVSPITSKDKSIKYPALPLPKFLNCHKSYKWHHLYVTPTICQNTIHLTHPKRKLNLLLLTFLSMKTNSGLKEAYKVFSLFFFRLLLWQDLLRILRGEFCLLCGIS